MARDDDFLAAATAAAQALTTARNALQVAQAAATREFPAVPDLGPLIDGIASALQGLQLPVPAVTMQAAPAPNVVVEAAQITVQAPPAAVNNFAPNVFVDVPEQAAPVVNVAAPVVNIEPAQVTVEAPSVRVQIPDAPARMPWRMEVHRDSRTQMILYADIVPIFDDAATATTE